MKASAQIVELPRPPSRSRGDLVITAQTPQPDSVPKDPGLEEVWSLIERASSQAASSQGAKPQKILSNQTMLDSRDSRIPESPPSRREPKSRLLESASSASVKPLFERVFRSFRVKLFDAVGPRYDELVSGAERGVRFLQPEFNLDALTDETAPATLDLVEEIVRRAPILKRSRLRKAASMLVADLYEKNYELLEKAGVLTKVEESYYRLKR